MHPRQIDYEKAAETALTAIHAYLQQHEVKEKELDGIFHGETGINRAKKARLYFSHLQATDDQDKNMKQFAILLALFSSSSSRLVGLIGNQWIQAQLKSPLNQSTIQSSVFLSEKSLNAALQNSAHHVFALGRPANQAILFNHASAARFLLHSILENELKENKSRIVSLAGRIEAGLKISGSEVDLTVLSPLSEPAEEKPNSNNCSGLLYVAWTRVFFRPRRAQVAASQNTQQPTSLSTLSSQRKRI